MANTTATTVKELSDVPRLINESRGIGARLADLPHSKTLGFSGVWGCLRAVLAAAVAQENANILMLLPQAADADIVAGDAVAFGLSQAMSLPLSAGDGRGESIRDADYADRLQVLQRLSGRDGGSDEPLLVTAYIGGALQLVPTPETLEASTRKLAVGATVDPADIRRWLANAGFAATTAVGLPGEFATRGGLLDIFSADQPQPIRVEWFGDQIESIRRFDVASQRSIERLDEIEIAAIGVTNDDVIKEALEQDPYEDPNPEDLTAAASPIDASGLGSIGDYLSGDTIVVVIDPHECEKSANDLLARVDSPSRFCDYNELLASLNDCRVITATTFGAGTADEVIDLQSGTADSYATSLDETKRKIDSAASDHQVLLVGDTPADAERLSELLQDTESAKHGRLKMSVAQLSGGFRLIDNKLLVLTGAELFHRSPVRRGRTRAKGKPIASSLQLESGDLVVHLSHGIGVYRGIQTIEKSDQHIEHLVIEFDGGSKIYVPSSRIGLIQRYIGGTKNRPRLAKIGGQAWAKQRKAAESAVTDMASELLEMQANRQARRGIVFDGDNHWQDQFDACFPYVETPDQVTAIADCKEDMEIPKPMDRLICGDVGFGKTEVAMRAAFKAVLSGHQVAVLVPTTVLAEQHYHNFRERMAEFPVEIAKLSRFCTKAQQRQTVKDLKTGKVDIVVGTHRLASKDVDFSSLGLVVVDEEQKFGVAVKERLKTLHSNVDVLTLSATPIPRTLHMALVGVRDISNLETPPAERRSVETNVVRWDDKLIRSAIIRELNRGGQIFFVHNRIGDMHTIAEKIKRNVPEVRIGIGHGQMGEGELEQVMVDFIEHKFDLLLATTIVESGLDIPNANTIFIDDGDRYGLSDLHQLRGRVGRYKHQAYCYLLIAQHKHLSPEATKRLRAIEEFSHMGAGFAISMRDLEIRGAGNLLGSQQSGHIAAIGYEMYCQLLEDAVRQVQNLPPKLSADVDIDLPVEAYLAEEYVPDLRHKIDLYRRMAKIDNATEIEEVRSELRDRFGPLPKPAERMLELCEVRLDAAVRQISAITNNDRFLVLHYSNRKQMEQIQRNSPFQVRIVDRSQAFVPLRPQRKPGTTTPAPKSHPGIDIDDPTGIGYLELTRQVLNLG
ncbi:transcription-repair coupling factor [Stieleria marina]|uniref:Transcription-repair-coupling factor n=1 Tax=Stieleria marina TaxID=1930275 RepID=A0A517NZ91_9BACT|nr:Transcription-repair-coupling factor [Planctomycetes bacterium K23_9]